MQEDARTRTEDPFALESMHAQCWSCIPVVGKCLPELGEGISAQLQNSDITVNGHGRKLMRLCEEAAMVLCTGRTPGDTPAQPSFRARSNTEPSRLDHVLVDCGLFPAVQSSRVGAHRHESDHFPLELQLLLTVPTLAK